MASFEEELDDLMAHHAGRTPSFELVAALERAASAWRDALLEAAGLVGEGRTRWTG